MKKNSILRKIGAGVMVLLIMISVIPSELYDAAPAGNRITHGTSSTIITKDMLDNKPPADYVINEDTQGKAKDGEYNKYFLKEDLQTVKITIDENNLNYVLQNAVDEPYVMAESVTIGDATLGYVGFKTKGSFTLEHAYTDNPGSDRFSFTINFGKYIKKAQYGKKQDFFGCNKISFNNFFFDKTMMKEFFALKLMDEMGLPTPQYGLAKLYINDQYYGVYAMVEAMDESILEQYYGVEDDELSSYLVKPEGTDFLSSSIKNNPNPLWENDEDTKKDVEDMLPTVYEWVEKLNALHEGTNFDGKKIDVNSEEYITLLNQIYDVDEVLRYFATHSWLCQMDNMFDGFKNYALYVDKQGKAMIMPWDYDLSFGCYYPSTAETTANFPLDVMWRNWDGSTNAKDFYKNHPLFNVIYQNETLRDKYHQYMKECSQIAALGGTLASTGATYEPGYFNSYIEAMEEEIYTAAGEKLASNVYYMNGIRQPADVKSGLPNLAKIIALRAVGVYNKVEGVRTTVSGAGCRLETLGNAIAGDSVKQGNITIVDAATGIFATADYARNNRTAVQLSLKVVNEKDTFFGKIAESLGCSKDKISLYFMSNKATPSGDYTLTIPMSQEGLNAGKTYAIYSCDAEGHVKELKATVMGNLYTVQTDVLGYIAVVEGGGNPVTDIGGDSFPWDVVIIIVVCVVLGAIFVLAFLKRNKNN